jgi:hypothetical protein
LARRGTNEEKNDEEDPDDAVRPVRFRARGGGLCGRDRVLHNGSVNNNFSTNYQYDKADNRTNKNTTGV